METTDQAADLLRGHRRRRAGWIGAALYAGLQLVGCGRMTMAPGSLPDAVEGERHAIESAAGQLSYYVAGPSEAPPLLLLHAVNAAASAYEVKPLFDHYRASRRVYAVELPGFGFSARSDREYTPRLMTDAVIAFVAEIRRQHGETPVDALAVSLSSEFLARAAVERPGSFRTLALVSPTGFSGATPRDGPPGSHRGMPLLHGFLTFPLWSRGFWYLLNSRISARYFLEKTWGSENIDEGLWRYDYLTAHQPGAWHAPYRFVSGYLFSGDIGRIYDALKVPVWLTHGVRGDFVDYRKTETVAGRSNWTVRVFETGALVYFEELDAFTRDYDAFLAVAADGS